jgi:protein-S-isoprenylcysteine O-methyltransferase Ste14
LGVHFAKAFMAHVSIDPSAHSFSKTLRNLFAQYRAWSPFAGLSRRAIALDVFERFLICAVFSQFAFRMIHGFQVQVESTLIILAELLPVLMILVRSPSRTLSEDRLDWIFGLTGTVGPLLIVTAQTNSVVAVATAGYIITMAGVAVQVAAKICLGRSFGIIAANRGVKVIGPYRLVRHPMYAGYMISYLGILLMVPSVVNAIIYFWVSTIHIIRIIREERILRQDPAYLEFASRVRYRLLPGVF